MSNRSLKTIVGLCVVLVVAWASAGCGSSRNDARDVEVRYALEKAMWKAEQMRKQAVSDPLRERHEMLRAAALLYEEILATEAFLRAAEENGDTPVGRDLRKLLFRCKIARAELFFLELEDYAGVTYPGALGGRHELLFARRFGLGLKQVKALYGPGPGDSLEVRCAGAYATLAEDPLFRAEPDFIGDTLLAGPAELARIQIEGEAVRTTDHARFAIEFYTRLIDARAGSPVEGKALARRAEVLAREGRFVDALGDVDRAAEIVPEADNRSDLLLWKGEILAHGLGREEDALRVLRAVTSEFPRMRAAHRAILGIAAIESGRGREDEVGRMLSDLEMDPETPRATRAAAVFLRALELDRRGEWLEAVQLFRQVGRAEPLSIAAAVSPLVIVEHDTRTRDAATVEKTLDEAAEFYIGAIARSADLKLTGVLADFLIESYLLAGEPAKAAELLESQAPAWRGDKGCVGLYKSGLIYLKLLHDREKGVLTLQKCLDVFPASRYAWMVREELDRTSPTSSAP